MKILSRIKTMSASGIAKVAPVLVENAPPATFAFIGPGVPLAILSFIGTLLISALIAFIIIRVSNPMFLRDVTNDQGDRIGISIWRSIWVSFVIALIPALLVSALVFYLGYRVTKAAAPIVAQALPMLI